MSEILKIINNIHQKITETSFSRDSFIDEKKGHYHLDCSSFFSIVLNDIDKNAFNLLKSNNSNRLKASDYYDFFQNENSFGEYNVVRESSLNVMAGDILIWRKINPPKSGDTGHIVIIKEVLEVVGQSEIKATVYDCTKLPHDNDTRTKQGGVGHGEMIFTFVNKSITGYIWSKLNGKNKRTEILQFRLIKSVSNSH